MYIRFGLDTDAKMPVVEESAMVTWPYRRVEGDRRPRIRCCQRRHSPGQRPYQEPHQDPSHFVVRPNRFLPITSGVQRMLRHPQPLQQLRADYVLTPHSIQVAKGGPYDQNIAGRRRCTGGCWNAHIPKFEGMWGAKDSERPSSDGYLGRGMFEVDDSVRRPIDVRWLVWWLRAKIVDSPKRGK
jgi:hypothetical protein